MRRPQFHRIADRLLFWVLGSTGLVFLAFALVNWNIAREVAARQAADRAELAVARKIDQIDELLGFVGEGVRAASAVLLGSVEQPTRNGLERFLHDLIVERESVFGMALAVTPGVIEGIGEFSPYYYRSPEGLRSKDLALVYDYLQADWFAGPVSSRQPAWSEPYFDAGGGELDMVTYSVPLIDPASSNVIGVLTADIALDTLDALVSDIGMGPDSYAYILSAEGHLITHQDPGLRKKAMTELPGWNDGSGWRDVLRQMYDGASGHGELPCRSGMKARCWYAFEPLPGTPWSIAAVIPLAAVEAELSSLARNLGWASLGALSLLAAIVLWLSRRISQPIKGLAEATATIARGDFEAPLPRLASQDEIGRLSRDFDSMRSSLRAYMTHLAKETAERERMASELRIAASIQAQMLPDGGSSDIEAGRFEMAATMRPAREVGGDFYLYEIHGDRLLFLVGDVSDKGVPAALFMARTVAEVRSLGGSLASPALLLQQLNQRLSLDNDHCMFVTAIAGMLDTSSGTLLLASAGHPAPLLDSRGVTTPAVEPGPALGLIDGATYPVFSLQLEPGNTLLIYTDGADEAMNRDGEALGTDALARAFSRTRQSARSTVDALAGVLDEYQRGRQFDDLTLMALRFRGTV